MKRLGRGALYLVPMAVFAIACLKAYQAPALYWPFPPLPTDDRLLRRPVQVLIALAGLFAPMPLCLAVSGRLRGRRERTDEVVTVGAQLLTFVLVELALFFGLAAFGAVSKRAFLAGLAAVALVGVAAQFDTARRRGPSGWGPCRVYLLIVTALASCGLASVHFGKDISYDFYNYHYYNAYAFLNGRDRLDFALADFVSHLNPFLDVAYYLLTRSVRPLWVGFVAGAAHGVAVVLLYAIGLEVFGRSGVLRKVKRPLALASAIAGACEPVFLGQLGTTMHDNLLASFVLAALLVVLRLVGKGRDAWTPRAGILAALAGASVGLATGFKLTTATYAVALGLALLAAPVPWRRRVGLAAALGAGGVCGFVLSNGYWMGYLYANFGSPFFPLYNAVFKSPYYAEANISYLHNSADYRWFDHWLVPFYFTTRAKVLSETPSSDLRLAVAYVLLAVMVLDRLIVLARADWRSPVRLREVVRGPITPGAVLVLGFAVVAYVVWYAEFRILRYLVALKLLVPTICVLLIVDLCRSRRRAVVASAAVLVLVSFWFDTATWGRGNWRKNDFLSYDVPAIEAVENGVVLLNASSDGGGFPNAIAALTTVMPPGYRYVRIDADEVANCSHGKTLAMEAQVLKLLRGHDGPAFLLTHRDPATLRHAVNLMRKYDYAIAEGQTPPRITGWYADLGFWRLERRPGLAGTPPEAVTR